MCKIYQHIWKLGGMGGCTYSTDIFCLLFYDLYLNQILHHFDLKKIYRMIIKNFRKRGPQGAPLLFLYEVSVVVLIGFIAILLTKGIFLIQIVNTNNTNVYLIHFHSKNNIKMHFPKSWVLKFQTNLNHSLFITTRWNKLLWHQQRLPNNVSSSDLK